MIDVLWGERRRRPIAECSVSHGHVSSAPVFDSHSQNFVQLTVQRWIPISWGNPQFHRYMVQLKYRMNPT